MSEVYIDGVKYLPEEEVDIYTRVMSEYGDSVFMDDFQNLTGKSFGEVRDTLDNRNYCWILCSGVDSGEMWIEVPFSCLSVVFKFRNKVCYRIEKRVEFISTYKEEIVC